MNIVKFIITNIQLKVKVITNIVELVPLTFPCSEGQGILYRNIYPTHLPLKVKAVVNIITRVVRRQHNSPAATKFQ